MAFQRLIIPADLDNRLRHQASRTGLSSNLLCRCAFCLSLREPGIPDLSLYGGSGEGQGREINRYTLLGEYDLFFFALLRERLTLDHLPLDDEEAIERQFKAHLFRGIGLLSVRVKSLEDIADLVGEASKGIQAASEEDNLPTSVLRLVGEGPTSVEQDDSPPALVSSETAPVLLMEPASTLWRGAPPQLQHSLTTGRPTLSLALADDVQTRIANEMVARYHYLRTPVDARCSLLAYLVLLGGQRIGCLIFGRPEATRVGTWYGSAEDKRTGRCQFSRWEILNLSRVWLDPIVQPGGLWYAPDILPGFHDRQGKFHSTLASTCVQVVLDCVVIDYMIAYPPVWTEEPYCLAQCLSYCDPRYHRGILYQQAGFQLMRENARGLQTYAKPLRPSRQEKMPMFAFWPSIPRVPSVYAASVRLQHGTSNPWSLTRPSAKAMLTRRPSTALPTLYLKSDQPLSPFHYPTDR
ncbi:DndE family protein [Reticulibacter mediterranei]|uniref:DndE family protein n=1 Tax=Reticulibacter mediterranei TaxID=2778369 RepID=UPI001C6942FD|nr:DndE family protein [Reticulibacter mediterranei]